MLLEGLSILLEIYFMFCELSCQAKLLQLTRLNEIFQLDHHKFEGYIIATPTTFSPLLIPNFVLFSPYMITIIYLP